MLKWQIVLIYFFLSFTPTDVDFRSEFYNFSHVGLQFEALTIYQLVNISIIGSMFIASSKNISRSILPFCFNKKYSFQENFYFFSTKKHCLGVKLE